MTTTITTMMMMTFPDIWQCADQSAAPPALVKQIGLAPQFFSRSTGGASYGARAVSKPTASALAWFHMISKSKKYTGAAQP